MEILLVDDHCRAVDLLIAQAVDGEVYSVGGGNEVANIDLAIRMLELLGRPISLIERLADRPGRDRRYCLDTSKLRAMGWTPQVAFEEGLTAPVEWHRDQPSWGWPIKAEDPPFTASSRSQHQERL